MMTRTLILGSLLAASAIPAHAQTVAIETVPVTGTVLEVTAEGEALRTPDRALVDAGVVTQAPVAADASRAAATRMAAIVAALRRAGIAERDLQTNAAVLRPQYRHVEGQAPTIIGYEAVGSVQVRFRDVARAGSVLEALVSAGANQIEGPRFTVGEPEAALDEARAQAMQRARTRADIYARAAGLRIKRVLTISESGSGGGEMFRSAAGRAMAADAGAPIEILAGERRLTASVTVRYELE